MQWFFLYAKILIIVAFSHFTEAFSITSVESNGKWKKMVYIDFSDANSVDNWILEGSALVTTTDDGWLRIETLRQETERGISTKSQLWYPDKLDGDLRITFDARSDGQDGSILIFNARALIPYRSIFEFSRAKATNADFAANPYFHNYTLGFLRPWQDIIRLRYNGGSKAWLFSNILYSKPGPEKEKAWKQYDDASILASAPSPYQPGKKYRIEVQVIGNRITVTVDSLLLLDVIDEWNADDTVDGGWFAFRNWRSNTVVEIDNLTVYTR